MSGSFPILRDQTVSASNSSLTVGTPVSDVCVPGRTTGNIGRLFQRTARNAGGGYERDRLSSLFQILSDGPLFLLRASPFGQVLREWLQRFFLPALATPAPCRHPVPRTAFLNSLGPLAPGLSALVKPAKQSARVFNVLFRPPFCFLLLHAVEVSERRRGWKAKVFPNLTKVLSVSK